MAQSRLVTNAARFELQAAAASIAAVRIATSSALASGREDVATTAADITGGSTNTIAANDAEIATLNAEVAALGPSGFTVVSKSATYSETATTGERIILCSGTFTINLPTAVGNHAKFTVDLVTAGAVTVDPAGTETIDGSATAVVNTQYASITFVSDGANWVII